MTSIGVGIPTYNRPTELANLLDSLAPGVRAFVSDNGNFLTQEFRDRYPSVVFKAAGSPAVPMFANWNLAARMADTEWVLVPSDDDIYYPDSFDRIADAAAANPSAQVLVFGHHVVGESYEILQTWQPEAGAMHAPDGFERFKYGVDARMPSVAIRRSALDELGYFDERFAYTASDSDLVQRALLAFDAAFVPDVVSGYRVWQQSATRSTQATQNWLNEIDYWGTKLARRMAQIPQYASQAARVREELYATNLLAGLSMLRAHGEPARCRAHFRASRFPWRARPATQLRILAQVMRASWR